MKPKDLQRQKEALSHALQGQSLTNYPAIFAGFSEKGIPEADIKPHENIFTYNAWRALGRQVRKGEHGVKVLTYIVTVDRIPDPEDPEKDLQSLPKRRPWTTTVFHVTQTEAINGNEGAA